MRAAFARCGWSLEADLGGRLRYVDAIALLEDLKGDPSTTYGAQCAGMEYPASIPEVVFLANFTGRGFPMPFPPQGRAEAPASFRGTQEEKRAASANMSPLFAGIG